MTAVTVAVNEVTGAPDLSQDLTPGSPAWSRLMSASKVAAVLSASAYDSPRSLWLKMTGRDPGEPQTREQARGHYLEPACLAWWRDQHPEYTRHIVQPTVTRPGLAWGIATPDMLSEGDGVPLRVVDAKSDAGMSDRFGTPGTDEMPLEYAAQLTWCMHLSGATVASLAVIGDRLEFAEYVLEYDAELAADIEEACAAFIRSVEEDDAPPLDDSRVTYESMRRAHPDIDRKGTVEVGPLLTARVDRMRAALAEAKAEENAVRSMLLEVMGKARLAKSGDRVVARRQAAPGRGAPYVRFP